MLGAIFCTAFAACGGDDDEPATLTVSPTQISLLSDRNSSSAFTINSNDDWTVTVDADWLMLSATSGTGNGAITITATSENASSQERTALITVMAAGLQSAVTVTQKPAYESSCSVEFKDIVALTNSVAFHFNVGSKVDYFLFGAITTNSAGWTDDKVVQWLQEEDNSRHNADEADDLLGLANMQSGRDYYLVAVAFDSHGNRGELTRQLVTIPSEANSDPIVNITDLGYSSTKWFFDLIPNGYTQKFYMVGLDGDYAVVAAFYMNPAEIALLMKGMIAKNELTALPNASKSWSMNRTAGAMSIYIATWGVNVDNEFSHRLNFAYGNISDDKIQLNPNTQSVLLNAPVPTHLSRSDLDRVQIRTE